MLLLLKGLVINFFFIKVTVRNLSRIYNSFVALTLIDL